MDSTRWWVLEEARSVVGRSSESQLREVGALGKAEEEWKEKNLILLMPLYLVLLYSFTEQPKDFDLG